MSDPAWDPAVRANVQRALNNVLHTAQDILTRYSDEDGFYVPPSAVSDGGDVTGLIQAGYQQVISRMQKELDQARSVMRQALADVDQYRTERFGGNYRSPDRDI
ncbi:hypothetical protein [Micromonospora globbae]|uniref:hypothetical protein n=1 Tax=Micromonospora globbae TaxID=1894969 RepID=UPI00342AC549